MLQKTGALGSCTRCSHAVGAMKGSWGQEAPSCTVITEGQGGQQPRAERLACPRSLLGTQPPVPVGKLHRKPMAEAEMEARSPYPRHSPANTSTAGGTRGAEQWSTHSKLLRAASMQPHCRWESRVPSAQVATRGASTAPGRSQALHKLNNSREIHLDAGQMGLVPPAGGVHEPGQAACVQQSAHSQAWFSA